jgi:hypothetical protein
MATYVLLFYTSSNWLLTTVTGWHRAKRPMHCGHFLT